MIVLGPASQILEETYLVSIESRGYIQEPEESTVPYPFLPSPPSPSTLPPGEPTNLPDLIPTGVERDSQTSHPVLFCQPKTKHEGRIELIVDMGHQGLHIRDLVHPVLSEPLRNQQQTTFKIVKLVSDFNHQLSKIHEQFAEDSALLVEEFRKRTSDILNDGPRSNSSISISWEQWMADVLQDSSCHTEIANTLSRSVARTLLEKTFHMKIQSRKVFSQRESYESIIAENEDKLSKVHGDYLNSWSNHVENQSPASLAVYLERHNNYAQQVHFTNAVIDQYYGENLPHLLQELDDVYTDVSGVFVDCLVEGSSTIAQKTAAMNLRWNKTSEMVRKINSGQDISMFIQSLSLPQYVPVNKHNFVPPLSKEVTNEMGLPLRTCEVVLDRVVSESARAKYESLRHETKGIEGNIKLINDSLETLIRIQAKNLDQQLFNKANEIQEEISRRRYELRVCQLQLAGLRAQKDLFSSKGINDTDVKGQSEVIPPGGTRERKLSTSSTGSVKSKWVKAFKTIKGKGDEKSKNSVPPGGGGGAGGIVENSHIFQEYTYKKITPCDVCSQILRGHTRQGLKCKMCRMNVHPDCQEKVVKCQPKSKLLRRQKSASDIDVRLTDEDDRGGDGRGSMTREEKSGTRMDKQLLRVRSQNQLMGANPPSGGISGSVEHLSSNQKQDNRCYKTSLSEDGRGLSSNLLTVHGGRSSLEPSPTRRRMGGSYSTYTPGSRAGIALMTDGELVDSSGRKITAGNYSSMIEEGSLGDVEPPR